VIANSQATAAPYRSAVPDKVNVVYNGVDLAEYEPERVPRGEYRAAWLLDPSNEEELAGIVVADHFDVIGYYDRYMFRADEHGHEQHAVAVRS
jgi:hypothetical protein